MPAAHSPTLGGAGHDSQHPPAAAASSTSPPDVRRYPVPHPHHTYATLVPPPDPDIVTRDFPSPFENESDFTGSPPLIYAHPAPVERVMQIHLTKYPHPSIPEIISCPVVSERVDADGVIHRERVVTVRNIAPWIFRRFIGGETIQLREKSTFDPRTRVFEMRSENEAYANLIYAKEASRFQPHPINPNWTSFVQYGGIRCHSYMGPLKRPLERLVCKRMVRGGLQAAQLVDDIIMNTQSPFE